MPGMVRPHQMWMLPLFVIGPLARSADDLELAVEVLTTSGRAGESGKKPELLPPRRPRFRDYRVAVWFTDSWPEAEIDAEVLMTLQKTVEKLSEAGLEIDEKARPDFPLRESFQLWGNIRDQLMAGRLPLYEKLAARQKKQQGKWDEFFKHYDVLLAPVSLTVAFPHDHKEPLIYRQLTVNGKKRPYSDNIAWTAMAVVSGLPATVAPVGLSESGLPVGVQIIGARYEDMTTIAFAQGLSELVGGFVAPPRYRDLIE
jgi:amidase